MFAFLNPSKILTAAALASVLTLTGCLEGAPQSSSSQPEAAPNAVQGSSTKATPETKATAPKKKKAAPKKRKTTTKRKTPKRNAQGQTVKSKPKKVVNGIDCSIVPRSAEEIAAYKKFCSAPKPAEEAAATTPSSTTTDPVEPVTSPGA